MRVTYDPRADTLRILFSDAPIFDTLTNCPDLTIDRDQYGHVVGVELSTASKHVTDPRNICGSQKSSWSRDEHGATTMSVILVGEGI